MALISVSVSTQHASSINVRWNPGNPEVLAIDAHTNLEPLNYEGAQPNPYERTTLHFHGTMADLQELSKRIAAALAPGYSSYPLALEISEMATAKK